MKKNAFVICEFNPFHNGHKYLFNEIRRSGYENIICIMSGYFMQRGDIAFCSKEARTLMALENGADVVIELPIKYCVSGASFFAEGAVKTAEGLGIDGDFVFGASADENRLKILSEIINSDSAIEKIKSELRNGLSYPRAVDLYIKEYFPEYSDITEDANSILGIEYINAIEHNSDFGYYTVKRIHPHDSSTPSNSFASASYIREQLRNGLFTESLSECAGYIPEKCSEILLNEYRNNDIILDKSRFEAVVSSRLLDKDASDFACIANVKQGLENRIAYSIEEYCLFSDMCDAVKTKRYTHSKIRQILISAALGIDSKILNEGIQYIRILGFNDKGRARLSECRETATVPLITNLSDTNALCEKAKREAALDSLCAKIFELSKEKIKNGNPEYKIKPVILSAIND